MELKITELTLSGFRTFEHLNLKELGRVNLITGRNNTGKSSILEALRLIASNADSSVILEILGNREESFEEYSYEMEKDHRQFFQPLSSIFRNFPDSLEAVKPINISIRGRGNKIDLGLDLDRVHQDNEGKWHFASENKDQSLKGLGIDDNLNSSWNQLAFVRTVDGKRAPMLLGDLDYRLRSRRSRGYLVPEWDIRFGLNTKLNMPYRYVASSSHKRTAPLADLWDEIALTDQEQHVIEALRIIDPNIDRVSMVNRKGREGSRTAVARVRNRSRPVPLRSFGDGIHRLFGITLSLVNAKGGLLLIDEFENGLHHRVQDDVWKIVFRLAAELDIQVFATSHSRDAVESFQQAATNTDETGKLVRLTSVEDTVEPDIFGKEELRVMTRERIEVR